MALRQDQVTCSFAPPGTAGSPVPCDERVPHGKAGFMAVRAFTQTLVLIQSSFVKAKPLGFFVSITLGRELTCLNMSIIC